MTDDRDDNQGNAQQATVTITPPPVPSMTHTDPSPVTPVAVRMLASAEDVANLVKVVSDLGNEIKELKTTKAQVTGGLKVLLGFGAVAFVTSALSGALQLPWAVAKHDEQIKAHEQKLEKQADDTVRELKAMTQAVNDVGVKTVEKVGQVQQAVSALDKNSTTAVGNVRNDLSLVQKDLGQVQKDVTQVQKEVADLGRNTRAATDDVRNRILAELKAGLNIKTQTFRIVLGKETFKGSGAKNELTFEWPLSAPIPKEQVPTATLQVHMLPSSGQALLPAGIQMTAELNPYGGSCIVKLFANEAAKIESNFYDPKSNIAVEVLLTTRP